MTDQEQREYNLLEQVAIELQIEWINDSYGNQVPLNQVEDLAKSIISERKSELRGPPWN